jgi:uncharacterized membrane protein
MQEPAPSIAEREADEAELHRLFAFGLERLVFFSDAVFAIAITLLAIDIRLPDLPAGVSDERVREALLDLLPELFAFTLSFAVIAQFWIGHFRTFRYVARADARLVSLNLAFLFCIALLPFPTSVVAQQGNTPTGAVFYAAFVVLLGCLSTLLWLYPTRLAPLGAASISADLSRRVTIRAAVIPIVFAVSIPIALVSPLAAWVVWFSSLPIQLAVTRRLGLRASLGVASGSPSVATRHVAVPDPPATGDHGSEPADRPPDRQTG